MADSNLQNLTEDTNPGGDSILYSVDDPAGTPVDRKVTIQNVIEAPSDVSAANWVVDEDNMSSDSATQVPTQQSVKAYVDSSVTSNATQIQGTDVDASVGTPSDGDILVYRSAGSDFVLEAKPAAGSNPAAADITDATADGIALITSADANPFTDADESKLDGIEVGADVTDTTNVTAAGALMDSEVTNLADVKAFDPADYAAAAHTHTHADITDYDTELAGKTNTTAFTPTADYHVATKKYVDDNAGGGGASQLSDLSDVNTSTATAGNVLRADGTDWESTTLAIDDISDVDTDKSKTPADGDVLTFDGTHWNAEAAAGGGGGGGGGAGQTLYDAVLDSSGGGDYTDLSTAVAAMSAGDTLFVRKGTYTETALAISLDDITIIGESPEESILDFNFSGHQAWSGANITLKNCRVNLRSSSRWQLTGEDMTIDGNHIYLSSSRGLYAIQVSSGHRIKIINNIIDDSGAAERWVVGFGSQFGIFADNTIRVTNGSDTSGSGWFFASGSGAVVEGNTFDIEATGTSGGGVLQHNGAYGVVSGNYVNGGTPTNAWGIITSGSVAITGNTITNVLVGIDPGTDCTVTGNRINCSNSSASAEGIANVNDRCAIVGNMMSGGTSATAIDIIGDNCTVVGNVINNWSVGVNVGTSTYDDTVIMGNAFPNTTTMISDSGTGTLYQTATDSDALNTN